MSELLQALKGASKSKSNGTGAGAPSAAELLAEEELNDELAKALKSGDAKAFRKILRKLKEDE